MIYYIHKRERKELKKMKTIHEILDTITDHAEIESIFICTKGWANDPDGQLVARDVDYNFLDRNMGDRVPDDWCLTYSEDGIEIGFLL